MSEKTLKLDNIRVNKKEFHRPNQAIDLMSLNVDQTVIFDNLNIVTMALSILLVIKKMKLLNRFALSYLK